METLIAYIIKANIALIIFYLLYVALLKKDTFFAFRRYFLLAAIVFSFVYPFIAVSAWGNIISFEKPQEFTTQVIVEEPTFAVVLADEIQAVEPVNKIDINWRQVLLFTLSAGFAFFLIRFVWQLISILHIKHKSIRKNIDGIRVFDLHDEITPFSFFRWIFIHIDSHSDTEIKQILLHEQTHARQWHSADVVLMELLCVFFWWNPIAWLIKRETAINLEHLADNGVLRKGVSSRDYQYHLLRLTYHQNATQIVNNFNVSLLKQRITMMNKTKSPARKLAKYLIALPLALLLVAGNSVYAQNQKGDEIFTEVEKFPEFPGGNEAFMKFLAENIMYPVIAQENNEQGRVVANFVVEKDGRISNIKVIRGVTAGLDAEAMRLLNSMPDWQPGEHKGQPARVRFTLPIVFRLQGEGSGESKSPVTPVSVDANEKGKMLDEVVVTAYARPNTVIPPPPPLPGRDNAESNGDEVFVVVENQPQYPGGTEAMNKFINENLQYPVIAQENGIQGRVIINFIIEKDGSLSDIRVVRGVDPALDKEAVRLIGSMPKWTPGKQRGYDVRVRYTLPITFRLSGNAPAVETGKPQREDQEKLKDLARKMITEEIFVVVEEQPEFSGGSTAMMNFISENISYPKIAFENGIQGRVITNFVVGNDGSISDVKIVRGVDPALDKEAVRVIESMPAWKPGKQRGQPVNVRFTLPVVFSLEKKEPKVIVDKLSTVEGVINVHAQAQPSLTFPGGNEAYMKYISDRIKYPVIAQENGVQGLVRTSFKIDANGKVTDAKIESGENELLNKEALRVINSMPQWTSDNTTLISGKVTDADSKPLQGATIIFKGTSTGTISDANGNFMLKVPEKEGALFISFVGFKTTEVPLQNIKTQTGSMEVKLPFVFRLQGDKIEPYKGPTPNNAIVIVGYAKD
ncbi:MAG: transport protein TonB [Bacteroidetes bacterium ADurb.BinA174]|nr:MAG: transport protein TonB [Bacteroidetes bacterium ADurb.BinA174]